MSPPPPGRTPCRQAGAQEQEHRDGHGTRQQEERDRLACDLLSGHSAAAQRPHPQRQAAGATEREQGAGALLGDRDLVARGPAHPRAEHGPESRNVGQHRQHLQRTGDPDPDRPRMGKPATQLPQARRERQDHHRDRDQPTEPQKSASQAVRRDIARERLGIRDTGRAAPRGDYGLVFSLHALMRRRPVLPWRQLAMAIGIHRGSYQGRRTVVETSPDMLFWRPLVPINATGAHIAHPAAPAARARGTSTRQPKGKTVSMRTTPVFEVAAREPAEANI